MIVPANIAKCRDFVLRFFASLLMGTLLSATAASAAQRMRWDITSTQFSGTTPIAISAGGTDSAFANDGSSIKLTGSGTFLSLSCASRFSALALGGGGTWQTLGPTAAPTGNGTYSVLRGPATFQGVPGTPLGITDRIGNIQDERSGLMMVEIRYNDGSRGILTASCRLPGTGPPTTPTSVFEGITVTKDFVDYWFRFEPVAGVDANRTVFHVLP
jgi:hypothetical protein